MKKEIHKIAVLTSGDGAILQAVIDAIEADKLDIRIDIVISDNPDAYALEIAWAHNMENYVIKSTNAKERDEELHVILSECDVDMVVLLDYLKLIGPKVLKHFTVINTHPSLLPQYGGKGMYGMKIHQAVVDNKDKESGATVHFIDEEYNKGSNIYQTRVPVYPEDTADDVSERVQTAEKAQIVSILKDFSEGKIDIPE